jgi:tetratricopeptide (TPR) repeat protein
LLLLWLLVAAQAPGVTPEYDLTSYLAVAAAYGSADHAAALGEIREWPPGVVRAAVADLRRRSRQLRAVPTSPGDIAFGTVEAAVLMHAEAGLLALESQNLAEAANHLGASVAVYQWSREAVVEIGNRAEAEPPELGPTPRPEIRPRIDIRDFSVALAATALAAGSPTTAHPFAEKARRIAPLDPEVQLVYGCVAEGLAEEESLRHRESAAAAWREQAAAALLDALALDRSLPEARLRLGRLLVGQGHVTEAEPIIGDLETHTADDRLRYLARLFLGRLAERRGRHDEAARAYARALEAWPDSQAARLALAHAVERSSGPAAALPLVAASLAASRRLDRAADPWWLYRFGPPGLAKTALDRLWTKVLDR